VKININLFSINVTVNRASDVDDEISDEPEKRETATDAMVERSDDTGTAELSSRDGRHDVVWENRQKIGFQRSLTQRG
jgi:hypothetical protein